MSANEIEAAASNRIEALVRTRLEVGVEMFTFIRGQFEGALHYDTRLLM